MGSKKKWGKFTKVMKYGNPTDIQSWNRMQHDEARRKELGLAAEAANARNAAGEQAAARSQELRDRWKRLYRPMEEGLAAEYMAGYNPDYEQITTQAQEDVGGAFERGAGDYSRNAARLGIDPSVSGDPEVRRLRGLDETAAKVFAGNTAVNTARDRAENLTANRGAQLIGLGQQRPYLASQESLAGNAALADILDYQTLGRANRGADRRKGDVEGGQAVASFFAHGGSVKKPMRYGINRPVINSTARRVYADGGEVTRPRREMGGAVGETARLSNMHREEYSAGKTDKQFGEWLDENGYELGADNMARPKSAIRASASQNADDRPRTPDFLFKPLKKAPRHYASGGLIDEDDDPRLQVSGGYNTFRDDDGSGSVGDGRVGYRASVGDGDLTTGLSFGGIDAKFNTPDGRKKVRDLSIQDVDVQYKKGRNKFRANIGRGRGGVSFERDFSDGGLIEDAPVDLETNDYIMPADVVSTLGREYFDDLIAESKKETKPHYASGGLVGGIRPGQGLANLASGFRDGQMDYRRMKAFDEEQEYKKEDREYLKGERQYQKQKRDREEITYQQGLELKDATSQFYASDGQDIQPLLGLYNRRGGHQIGIERNESGSYQLSVTQPDGSNEVREVSPREIKSFGMNMAQGLSNPASWLKANEPTMVGNAIIQRGIDGSYTSLYEAPSNDYTPIGGGLGVLNRKTGKVEPGLDPDTLRSVRSRSPAGPKAVRYPQRGMVLDAEDLLSTDPDLAGLSEEDRKALALNVASRAQGLLGEQPGIDASEAIAQALDEERTNVTSGEKREHFGLDWLARDVAPTYQDRRRVPVTVTPAEQALKAKMNARANPRTPARSSPTEPTAVNPKTGERIVYRNGQWQPLR